MTSFQNEVLSKLVHAWQAKQDFNASYNAHYNDIVEVVFREVIRDISALVSGPKFSLPASPRLAPTVQSILNHYPSPKPKTSFNVAPGVALITAFAQLPAGNPRLPVLPPTRRKPSCRHHLWKWLKPTGSSNTKQLLELWTPCHLLLRLTSTRNVVLPLSSTTEGLSYTSLRLKRSV